MVSIEPLLCVRHCSKYFILNPHSSGVAAIISDVSDEEIYTEITDLPVQNWDLDILALMQPTEPVNSVWCLYFIIKVIHLDSNCFPE